MTVRSQIAYYDQAGNRLVGGAAGDTWSADALNISTAPNNAASSTAGALFAEKLISATFDGGTGLLTLGMSGAALPITVNLATLSADKFLSASSFDPLTNILTLTMTDASTYTVDLSDLVPSAVAASTTATVSGDGTNASPLTVDVKISATAGNALTVDATGLFVSSTNLTATTAPSSTTETGISTVIIGGINKTMGEPAGFLETADGKKIPYYS